MIPTVFSTQTANDNILDRLMNEDYNLNKGYNNTVPGVNILEHPDKIEMQIAVPGIDKSDIAINLEDDVLTISAEKEASQKDDKINYLKREFAYNCFKRAFNLPEDVNQDKIEANQQNGILYITLPKKETAVKHGPRSIEVQ